MSQPKRSKVNSTRGKGWSGGGCGEKEAQRGRALLVREVGENEREKKKKGKENASIEKEEKG